MKTVCTLFIALTLGLGLSAQVFEEGGINANVGIGLGFIGAAQGATKSLPPLSLSAEYGVTENIGVGGYIGYASSTIENETFISYKIKYNYLIVGARGAYHFKTDEKLDLYGGAMLGYNIASSKITSDSEFFDESLLNTASAGGVSYSIFGGGRYMFAEKVGAFGELGYGISYFTLGLTMKM